MNKKKALFTSLAALALASTQAQTFAEEVTETLPTEPVAAAEATPAEAVIEEVQTTSTINVDALLAGDFSSVAGEWELEGLTGKVIIDENGYLGGVQDNSQKLATPVLASEISPTFDESVLAFRGGTDINTANIDDYFFFYPVGMPLDRGISSDETRNRLVIGHKESSYAYPYYLVTASTVEGTIPTVDVEVNEETADNSVAIEENSSVKEEAVNQPVTEEVASPDTTPVVEAPVVEEDTPVVSETVAPTTSEVVQVPVTAKTEPVVAPIKQATPAKQTYSRTEKAQSDKGFLPSTGEATSVLALVGSLMSGLGLAGLRRRK